MCVIQNVSPPSDDYMAGGFSEHPYPVPRKVLH